MAQVTAVFEGDAALKWLSRLEARVRDAEDGIDEFAGLLSAVVFQDIMGHFRQAQGSKGPWKAWSDVYAAHMRRVGKGGNNILIDSGKLRQAFLPTNYRRAPGGIQWFNPAKTASGFPYAYAHDEGGPKLPQRDFMWLSDAAGEKIEQITLTWILEE